jgi:hypothetical protein
MASSASSRTSASGRCAHRTASTNAARACWLLIAPGVTNTMIAGWPVDDWPSQISNISV